MMHDSVGFNWLWVRQTQVFDNTNFLFVSLFSEPLTMVTLLSVTAAAFLVLLVAALVLFYIIRTEKCCFGNKFSKCFGFIFYACILFKMKTK